MDNAPETLIENEEKMPKNGLIETILMIINKILDYTSTLEQKMPSIFDENKEIQNECESDKLNTSSSSNDENVKLNDKNYTLHDYFYYWVEKLDFNENLLILTMMNIDKFLSKNFILTANFCHVKSYDFSKNELYHEYNDNDNRGHYSIIIKNIDNIIKLIESCTAGNIRIWNFHSGMLIIKIRGSDKGLRGICLWDDNFLFAGSDDKTFKLIDIKNKSVPKVFNGHDNKVITLKSIIHPKFGKCLITQAFQRDKIKIWKNRNILI